MLTVTVLYCFATHPPTQAVAVPVLSVRLKLRAREEARLESERKAMVVKEKAAKKQPTIPSYLKPLNKRVNEKSLAEPPPRLLLLRNLNTGSYNSARLSDGTGERSGSRGRSSTDSVPGYMQNTSRSAAERFRKSRQSARGRVQSAVRATKARSSSQRRPSRGRSSTASRRRGGASRSWLGHVSKSRSSSNKGRSIRGNKTSSGNATTSKRGRRSNSTSVSPRRPTWPAMSKSVRVARPSRLKLRG